MIHNCLRCSIRIKGLNIIPIRKINPNEQKPFISLVDKILAFTKSEDYQNNESKRAEVKKLEAQINQMVNKLYDLTPAEIAIVEGKD